jgi:hypothetical protein
VAILAKTDGLAHTKGCDLHNVNARHVNVLFSMQPLSAQARSQRLMRVEEPPAANSLPGLMLLFSSPEHPF